MEELDQIWAEEDGLLLRLIAEPHGIRVQMCDVTTGRAADTKVLAELTIAGFRLSRISEAIAAWNRRASDE